MYLHGGAAHQTTNVPSHEIFDFMTPSQMLYKDRAAISSPYSHGEDNGNLHEGERRGFCLTNSIFG